MPRHHTISYPKKWILDGGYWQEAYQEDIPFTPEEEVARDEEEERNRVTRAAEADNNTRHEELEGKLKGGLLTFPELLEMMQRERWGR
mgnify:CR=1 FL=1